MSLGNPYTAGAREGSIWFWMRLSRRTEVDGLIVDCQGGIRISVNGTFVLMQLNSNERLWVRVTTDIEQMFSWNSYLFNFKNEVQQVYINGKLAGERRLSSNFGLSIGN